tara:strand:+ start:2179 stop:3036 length:858 start_codon:yes stop_codon:yes gene_type:complete
MNKKVYVKMTNGFGNNLFQYVAARLLGQFHGLEVLAIPPSEDYYAIPCLKKVGVKFGQKEGQGKTMSVNDSNYIEAFNPAHHGCDFLVSGYFEDYRYYIKLRDKIMSWFPQVSKKHDKDLVLHLRTGDRLFYKNEFFTKPKVEDYLKAIEEFQFERMHIVTDMPEWKPLTEVELNSIEFHLDVPADKRVSASESVAYFNSLVEGLARFEPLVQKRAVGEDFDFMRSFDNILFQHGTLGWWSAFLSDASKVGVYGPWRPWKGVNNKNLANIPLKGWFKWGPRGGHL